MFELESWYERHQLIGLVAGILIPLLITGRSQIRDYLQAIPKGASYARNVYRAGNLAMLEDFVVRPFALLERVVLQTALVAATGVIEIFLLAHPDERVWGGPRAITAMAVTPREVYTIYKCAILIPGFLFIAAVSTFYVFWLYRSPAERISKYRQQLGIKLSD